jgi:hypothetical protein
MIALPPQRFAFDVCLFCFENALDLLLIFSGPSKA